MKFVQLNMAKNGEIDSSDLIIFATETNNKVVIYLVCVKLPYDCHCNK